MTIAISPGGRERQIACKSAVKRNNRFRVQKLAVAVVTTFALSSAGAACGGSGTPSAASTSRAVPPTSNEPTPTTVTPSSRSSATTEAPTSTTVQGPTGPASDYPAAKPTPPSLAGAYPEGSTVNLVTVIKTLTAYEDWVYAHPNPALVANYMMTAGSTYKNEVQDVTTLQQKGWHTDPTPTIIQWAKVTAPAVVDSPVANGMPEQVKGHRLFRGGSITVVQDLTGGSYLNTAGAVVGHFSANGLVAFSVTLAQEASGAQPPNGQFRIVDVTELHPPGGVSSLETS